MVEDLEDNFVSKRVVLQTIINLMFKFALRGFSTAYANTEPGSSSLVSASWEADDNVKLQRVNAPNDDFHIISGMKSNIREYSSL